MAYGWPRLDPVLVFAKHRVGRARRREAAVGVAVAGGGGGGGGGRQHGPLLETVVGQTVRVARVDQFGRLRLGAGQQRVQRNDFAVRHRRHLGRRRRRRRRRPRAAHPTLHRTDRRRAAVETEKERKKT